MALKCMKWSIPTSIYSVAAKYEDSTSWQNKGWTLVSQQNNGTINVLTTCPTGYNYCSVY